jgi:benzoate membrane transport protein
MVCGVFLPFGLKIITGFEDDPWIALAIVVAFIATSAMPALERVLPPVLAALAAEIVAVIITGHGVPTAPVRFGLAHPNILLPEFSLRVLLGDERGPLALDQKQDDQDREAAWVIGYSARLLRLR